MQTADSVVSLSFFRFTGLSGRLWAFAQMGLARGPLARLPGIGFHKLLGTGTGEGFTPLPNTGVYAILATWPSLRTAERTVAEAEVFRRYRRHAGEAWTVFLSPVSARGAWDGAPPFVPAPAAAAPSAPPEALAVLTRATVRARAVMRFWGRVPSISRAIGRDPNVAFKIGMGEVPWFHQVTFSIWPDAKSMAAFAIADGPHARAVRAVREGNWFAEELYARFHVLGHEGSWAGGAPLAALALAPPPYAPEEPPGLQREALHSARSPA